MNQARAIRQELENVSEGELIFANRFYQKRLSDMVGELAYYKYLERLCQSQYLAKIGKGVYCRPKETKFGYVLPSEKEIINQITSDHCGMEVGYGLFNRLNLTTQVPKSSQVFSAYIDGKTKRIGNVFIKNYQIDYSEKIVESISVMEVLQHFNEIEELNLSEFKRLCERFAGSYDEEAVTKVIQTFNYPKRTIAFLQKVLDWYGVKNNLGRYLSKLSDYKIPDLEGIL